MLTLDNRSKDAVKLGLFARPAFNCGLEPILWRVFDLAPEQIETVDLPRIATLIVNYGGDRAHPDELNRVTEPLTVTEAGTNFVIAADTARDPLSVCLRPAPDPGEPGLTGVINRHDRGVSLQLRHDGVSIVTPVVLWPDAAFVEAPWPRLFALVVAASNQPGDPIGTQADEGFPCEITADTRRLTITGALWEGYSITATDDDA